VKSKLHAQLPLRTAAHALAALLATGNVFVLLLPACTMSAEPCPVNRYLLQAGLPQQVAEAAVNPGRSSA
jgi:acyl-CoA reductase-like NAD-dependent aldehyde dehydrogenase